MVEMRRMEVIGLVLLAAFCTTLILGPILCVLVSRRMQSRQYHPRESSISAARRKLRNGTEIDVCRRGGGGTGEKLAEEGLHRQLQEPEECPICITSLHSDAANRVASDQSPNTGCNARTTERSQARGLAEKHPCRDTIARLWKPWRAPGRISGDSDDDILTLNRCHHSFHARCLASWFLIGRYDCPVCRQQYWGPTGGAAAAQEPSRRQSRSRISYGPGAVIAAPAPARIRGSGGGGGGDGDGGRRISWPRRMGVLSLPRH